MYEVLLFLSVPFGVLLWHWLDESRERRYLRLYVKMGGLGYPIADVTAPTSVEIVAGVR